LKFALSNGVQLVTGAVGSSSQAAVIIHTIIVE
jgi:hypothetical protein